MPSDRSRSTDPPCDGYTGVVAQQGRVILDRDFNASQGFAAARIDADALDFVGPCGTPDNGFQISLPGTSSGPFWSPPVTPPAESPPITIGSGRDFLISPGTMYVGGQRVCFPAEQDGVDKTYTYFDQPDWPDPPQPNANAGHELVYLDLTEQEVSAVEDPDLLEVALGGPDTTQRLKLLRRVERMSVTVSDCTSALEAAQSRWAAEGWQFDPATMQLLPTARLLVGFTTDPSASGPCDPVATGGYMGADNQMIRVRIAGSKTAPTVLWSYDNASFLYLVTSVDAATRTTLTLASAPPDALHVPQTKQVLEVLATAAVLGTEPEVDPVGPQPVLRVAADATGYLRALAPPTQAATSTTLVLDKPLPQGLASSSLPLFLRVWQGEETLTPGKATALKDPVTGTSTGVTVTISAASGTVLTEGAFWQIAVRPATPQGVYPESLLTTPQPPDGPRRWVCPLAVITWADPGSVADCRNSFDNLVTLSRRKPGCCTVSIGPQDVNDKASLQSLIDKAVSTADEVTVCLSPGAYSLPRSLQLTGAHGGLTLESCGGPALLLADANADLALFSDGLVVLHNAIGVTLRGLTLRPSAVPIPRTLIADMADLLSKLGREKLDEAKLTELLRRPYSAFAVRAFDSPDLTVDSCIVPFLEQRADEGADLLGAAVFLQGDCTDAVVRDCSFLAEIVPTYTPITLQQGEQGNVAPAAAAALDLAVNRIEAISQPASPPLASADLVENRLGTMLDALVAHREAEVYQATPKPIIATCGVIAAEHLSVSEDSATIPCLLGAASIRDTSFTALTFATWICAMSATLRVQDNIVSEGVAGLWLGVPDFSLSVPSAGAQGTNEFYPQCLSFEEFLALYLFSAVLPPPSLQSQRESATPVRAQDFSLFVLGNQIDATGFGDRIGGSTAALMLSLNRGEFQRTRL